MIKKTLTLILAVMVIAASGCNNAQPAATTTNAVQEARTDASEDLYFYTEDIKYYLPSFLDANDGFYSVLWENNASDIRTSVGKCREITEKLIALDCPYEPMSEAHDTMIADGENYLDFLDKMDKYAYYLEEAQTRTDFTDEEMQEINEIMADPFTVPTAFQDSLLAALDAAQLYLQ